MSNFNVTGALDCSALGEGLKELLTDHIYPVGSYFITESKDFNTISKVQAHFGGTWVQVTGTFLYGSTNATNSGTASQAGEMTHVLTTAEMPSHTHTQAEHSHKFNRGNKNEWSGNVISGHTSNARYLGWVEQTNGGGDSYQYTSGKGVYVAYPETPAINPTGEGKAHNNMPPYREVYMYRRTS